MKELKKEDLQSLAIGCTYLGSGGGGDPQMKLMLATQMIEEFGPVKLIDVEELDDDDLVLPLATIGAPLVSIEMLLSGREFEALFQAVEKRYGKKPAALISAEIGGSNGFTPLIPAARHNIPVIDGDLIGRAFPELAMTATHIHGISASPAFIANNLGTVKVIEAASAEEIEKKARPLVIEMGSSVVGALYIMSGKEAKRAIVKKSVTHAIQLGKQKEVGICIGKGIITDIQQEIQRGFLLGALEIQENEKKYRITFQNEFLRVLANGQLVCETPDIIALVDEESKLPLSIEKIRFGLHVEIKKIEVDPVWKTEKGIALARSSL